MSQNDDVVITINVGGCFFTSLKSTFEKSGYLKSMFRSSNIYDENGYVFIDRDAYMFTFILFYLRTGNLSISADMDKSYAEFIKTEIKFYKIDDATLNTVGRNTMNEISVSLKGINQAITSIQKNNSISNFSGRRSDWGSSN